MAKRSIFHQGRDIASHGKLFLKHVLPAAVRPIHTLWHEIIGFLFIVMAIIIGASGFRAYRSFDGQAGDLLRIGMAVFAVVLLGGYGISSFRRARKISRS